MRNEVILVNGEDEIIGAAPKLEAHRKGLLHRAFSILISNSGGEILLQQRAHHKYHSAGLWSNTCCSHPQPGEDIQQSARARLYEEMRFDCPLQLIGKFHYKALLDNELTENEIDYVFAGQYNGPVNPDEEEAAGYRWASPDQVLAQLQAEPQVFTYWFPEVLRLAAPRR